MSVDAEPSIERAPAPRALIPRAERPGLSASGRANARALAETLWSRDGTTAPAEDRLSFFTDDLSDFVGHLNTRARLLFLSCLATVTFLAPLLLGRFARLRSLSIEERIRAIHALERTPLSLALFAAKAIVSLVWYEHPDTAREIGWDQRCKKS